GNQFHIPPIIGDIWVFLALENIGIELGSEHQFLLADGNKPRRLEKQGVDTAGLFVRLAIGLMFIPHAQGIGAPAFMPQDLLPKEAGSVAAVLKRPRSEERRVGKEGSA